MKTQDLREAYKQISITYWGISQWSKGVQEYAYDMLENLYENYDEIENENLLHKALLNGAEDWRQSSWGGCWLIYDKDIAERLATNSEIKRRTYKNGQLNNWANAREQWLDVQARALFQAETRIKRVFKINN